MATDQKDQEVVNHLALAGIGQNLNLQENFLRKEEKKIKQKVKREVLKPVKERPKDKGFDKPVLGY